jgi:hypothetical protein
MKIREKQGEFPRQGAAVLRRLLARLRLFSCRPKELRGLPVVVCDNAAELALAADLAVGLWPEAGIEHVVSDLSPLMQPLRVVVREPQRHDAVELLRREADDVV